MTLIDTYTNGQVITKNKQGNIRVKWHWITDQLDVTDRHNIQTSTTECNSSEQSIEHLWVAHI